MADQERIHLFNGFTLDLARGCVIRAGEPIHLRPQSYNVLKYLVENKGRLISKDKLIAEVWQGRAVTDGSLGKCIEELREALGPESKQFIRNVRGRGYIVDLGLEDSGEHTRTLATEQIEFVEVTVEEQEQMPDATSASALPVATRLAPQWRLRTLAVSALVVVAAATLVGVYRLTRRQPKVSAVVSAPFRDLDIARLTSTGTITHAAISPDGKYVANVVKDAQGNSLWLKHIAAPSNVRIAGPAATEYISVTFAPDGKGVYYIALDHDKGESTLYRVPLLGGPSDLVAHDIYPIGFSPDGRKIAFIRFRGSESHLVVADADGTNQREVATRHKPDAFELEWNAPAWSPDGKTIACPGRLNDQRGHYGAIIGVSLVDGSQAPLTSTRWDYVGQPVWLADGSGLLMTASDRPGAPKAVWHVGLPDRVATRITRDLNDYHDLSLTADANRLVAVQVHSISNIWVAPEADARDAKQIRSEIGLLEVLAWTPDEQIVYRSSAGGSGADIWIMKADGSDARQLTVGARVSRGLAVTPNGRHITFSSDRAGQFNLWRMDRDGGDLRQLTAGDGEFYPQCTPDGQWVVYQVNEVIDPRLWKVPIDGGAPVQLTKTRATKPTVSPDGELIAYSYLDIDLNPSRWGIGIVSFAEGERLKRFDFPPTVLYRQVRWSPDGRSIAFVNSPGGLSDIWLQPLAGGPSKPLTDFKAEQILAFDWSPISHSLAFVRSLETSDVVLIEQAQNH